MARKKRTWQVACYCRHADGVLLVRQGDEWVPIEAPMHSGETPLEAAKRVLKTRGWPEARFPAIHKVEGAPPGLLLYEEHDADSQVCLTFVFVVEVPDPDYRPTAGERGSIWVLSRAELPFGCPLRVQVAMPFALTAGREQILSA